MVLDELVNSERVNALIGWVMIGVITIGAAESFLTNDHLWGGFSLFVATVASLPALKTHDLMAIVPWPLLSVTAIAVIVRTAEFYPEAAGYLAITTLAFIAAVELDMFTPVRLSRGFAVGFGVLMTMALEALWIIAQFYSDKWLGTAFLTTQTELQEDIVIVTVVGFAVGGLFYGYFAMVQPANTVNQSSNRTGTK